MYYGTMTANDALDKYSYPVRRGIEAANRASEAAGYNYTRTSPPPFGYYVTNRDAEGWDSLRRSQAVTETQQKLSTVSVCMKNEFETATYDAARAYFEYTDPFGAKTYA
jgi:hypothetical protein